MDGTMIFCPELSIFLHFHSFTPDAVFFYEETRLIQRGGNLTTGLFESADKERANSRLARRSTFASLLTLYLSSQFLPMWSKS